METYATILNYAILFFTALIALEFVASLILKKSVNYGLDTISSLSSGMTNTLKDVLGLGIVLFSYRWMFKHFAVFEIHSTILLYILGFILVDFSAYWSHRWNHVINIMWNRHVIHHSSEEFNLSAALRQSISGIVGVYFFLSIPMAIVGIPPEIIGIILPLHLFAQFWYHTRLINRMGFLEKIIVTPSHHRVHHAINPQYLDKNYAAVFIIWDKLFGTFQEELEEIPPVYGVKSPVNTWNPILINWMHAWQILKDAWRAKEWKDKLRIWFMPTGWRPADVAERFPIFFYENDVYQQKKYRTSVNRFLLIWFWFQLTLHLLLEIYLFNQIAAFDYTQILLYGIFLFISIFGYTTLMDRHLLAIPAELIKMIFGFYLLKMMNGWYGLDNYFSYASWCFGGYLFLSMGVTLYYSLGKKSLSGLSSNRAEVI